MATREFIHDLETRRDTLRDQCETILNRAKAEHRDTLTEAEDVIVQDGIATMRGLNQRIVDEQAELHRTGRSWLIRTPSTMRKS